MNKLKPITRLKILLGFSSNQETARFFGLNKNTADSLNLGRGSEYTYNFACNLCLALEHIPPSERRSIFKKPGKRKLTLAQKYRACNLLEKRLKNAPEQVQEALEKTTELLTEYIGMNREYEELRD